MPKGKVPKSQTMNRLRCPSTKQSKVQLYKMFSQRFDEVGSIENNESATDFDEGKMVMELVDEINKINNVCQVGQTQLESLQNQLYASKMFLNMIIHDMRNPTTSIKIGLESSISQLSDVFLLHLEFQRFNKKCNALQNQLIRIPMILPFDNILEDNEESLQGLSLSQILRSSTNLFNSRLNRLIRQMHELYSPCEISRHSQHIQSFRDVINLQNSNGNQDIFRNSHR